MIYRLLNSLINGKYVIALTLLFSLLLAGCSYYLRSVDGAQGLFLQDSSLLSLYDFLINWGLLITGSFLLFLLNKRFQITRDSSRLFFVFPVLFVSCTFLPVLTISESIAALLFVMSYFPLFHSYQRHNAMSDIFNSSLALALVVVLIPVLWVFIPVYYIGLYMFRSLSLKSFLASIVALLTPQWLLTGYYYYTGYAGHLFPSFESFQLVLVDPSLFTWKQIWLFSITSLGVLSAVIHLQTDNRGDKVRTRLFLQYSILIIISLLLIALFLPSDGSVIAYLFFIASTPLLSRYFTVMKSYYSAVLFYLLIFSYLSVFILELYDRIS